METAATTAPDLVTVTVNGVEKKFPKGKNLLAALLDADTYVPHYCWHPSLSIAGNCRLCLIEIEGQPRPNVSCNMSCTEGLKIKTEGAMVEDCRKGMMEFLLVNHPLDCPICDRGGECMLQRYSMEYGFGHARTADERRRFEKPQFDPLIDIERNRCIMCTRCVRYMDEVAGEHTLAVVGRGNRNYIATFGDGPVANNFSGNIIDLCPVGCLTSKPFRFEARAWELQQVGSTCTLCSAGCPTTAWLRDGELKRMTPPARKHNNEFTIDEDTTQFICNEGRFGNYYVNSPERLEHALMRGHLSQQPADLTKAIRAAGAALKSAAAAGPEKVAILAGARSTNEEYFLLSRLARETLGTNQIDWRAEYISDTAAQAAGRALAASDGDLAVLDGKGCAATLVVGADLLDSVPVIGLKIKEAARHRRTKLAIVDAREDGWLSEQAAAKFIVAPEKLADALDQVAAAGEKKAKVSAGAEAIRAAISTETGLLVLGLDTAGGAFAPQLVRAAFALLEKLGPGWKFLPVFRARNAKGAFASGAQSDRLPGGVASGKSDATAPAILRRAAAGEIQTLLLHRCDELVHHVQRELVAQALAKTPTVIVIDTFPSWISEKASIVLPGALFFETEGSMASADGTLQSLFKGNQPPGDAQEDWRLIASLTQEAAAEGTAVEPPSGMSAQSIFRELLAAWKPARAFTLDDLRLEGAGAESPQRTQPIIRKKTRPNFKLHFNERAASSEASASNGDEALRLYWHIAIHGPDHLGARSEEYDSLRPEPIIEINPSDATGLGLAEGDMVQVKGCRVQACSVVINPTLPEGIAAGAANVLGLAIAADAQGLPEIEIVKAEVEA